MAQIMQDKYVLGQSPSQSISSVGQELRIDLQLTTTTNSANSGRVTGIVSNASGTPVANALVKLMDTNYNPITHAITNSSGSYTLTNVAPGSYCVFAIAQGTALQQSPQFSVAQLQTATQNLTLQADPAMSLAIIPGIVKDGSTNTPIGGAVASLYLVSGNTQTLQSVLYTNQYGQFVFRQVPTGTYLVTISALGYTTTNSNVTVNSAGQIVPMTVSLTQDATAGTGTISGIITDANNAAIASADVILYQVNSDNSLTPMAFTKTNSNGIYLFGSVAPGNYKVKSNQTQLVTVGVTNYAPNFSGFELFYAQNYYVGQYLASAGTMANGAAVNTTTGFVTGLNTGSVTLNVTAPSAGDYVLAVSYIAGGDEFLSVSVNNATAQNILCYRTPTINPVDAQIRQFTVTLASGANTVKFYNGFQQLTPNINKVDLLKLPYSVTNSYTQATYEGNAAKGADGFITGLGGAANGSVTFTINVPTAGNYYLSIPYRNTTAAALTMKVAIDVNTEIVSSFAPTPTTPVTEPLVAAISLGSLTAGNHTIEYYNDGATTIVPGPTKVLLLPISISTLAKDGALASGASVASSGYVIGLGGANKGSVTITTNAPLAGLYCIGVQYVNGNNVIGDMKVSVNGGTAVKYVFPKTASNSTTDVKWYYMNLNLTAGSNTIKFYNDDTAATVQSPLINTIYIQRILVNIPYAVNSTNINLQNGASVQNGMITNIGTGLGFIILSYPNIPFPGLYNLNMSYATTTADKVCTIDVNGVNTGTTYTFTATATANAADAQIQSIPVNLIAGANTIKVYTN